MSRALYRKYRSKKLSEIVGQEHITDILSKALMQQRIGHAFLFTGPRGVGKTSIARILAHEINELPYADETNHLDIIEIDAASNRRIDDIRDLRDKVHIAPTGAKYKVYIIDEVHMLTGESFNALLKTLEEPPSHVVFILATTESHKLPATIISRTQRFHFRPVPRPKVIAHLKEIAQSEGINIDDTALTLIADHGEGSFRDSISMLDQLGSLSGNEPISSELVEATLGLAPQAQVERLVEHIVGYNQGQVIAMLHDLESTGVSPTVLVSQIINALRKTGDDHFNLIDQLLEVPKAYHPNIKLLTVLANHTRNTSAQASPRTVATVAAPAPVISAPAPKKAQKEPQKTPEKPKKTEPKTRIQGSADAAPESINWDEVLEFVRTKSVPLFSVLKHGKAEYSDGVLTLYFARDLHRKKLDDARYSAQFASYLQEKYGACPEINAVLGAPAPQDETAASVAAIMGGGEEVNVEAK